MAFVCTVSEELTVDGFSNGDTEFVVKATVGYDDATGSTYSVLVCLSPWPAGGVEIAFSVVEAEIALDYEHAYLDGRDTKPKIPDPADRAKVLEAICTLVDHMIAEHNPSRVYQCAAVQAAPDGAVRKHLFVNQVFADAGYRVEEHEPALGTRMWVMERVT